MPKRRQTRKFKQPNLGDMYLDAIAHGDSEFVEQYLDSGNDALYRDCLGRTGLHVAAAHNQPEMAKALLPYFTAKDLDMRNSFGRPAEALHRRIGDIIDEHHKRMFKRAPRHKPYSFAKDSIQRQTPKRQMRKASPQQLTNPVIYPNEANAMNLYYSPKFNTHQAPPYIPVYHSRNTKRVTVINKKTRKNK